MRIKKQIEKEKLLLSDICRKICWRFSQVKHQKVIKKKKQRHKDTKLWINMHNWRGFIMTSDFKLTCMLSCMLILRQFQQRTIFLLQKLLLINTRTCKLQDHPPNICFNLVTYVHKIMSYIITLIKQTKNQTIHPTIKLNCFAKIL